LLDTRLDEGQSEYVATLRRSADHLLQLMNDVLDFSKLDADRVELEEDWLDLAELTDSVAAIVRPRAAAKGLSLICRVATETPRKLYGDAGRLRQVLLNLASNAVQFTAAGQVVLEVLPLSVDDHLCSLQISVTDTGIGITPEGIALLFREFSQVDGSLTRRHQGTGLGLAISKRLVELMGGTISVGSEPGRGTAFTVRLALRYANTEALRELEAKAENSLARFRSMGRQGLSVLLVEDNRTNQMVASALLEREGFQVDTAGNGFEALEAVENRSYDLILMDMMMPEMDGLQATRFIRTMPGACRTVPILALTANAFTEDRQACIDAGMTGFLAKPVSSERLAAALSDAALPARPDGPMLDGEVQASLLATYGDRLSRFVAMFLGEAEQHVGTIAAGIEAGADLVDLRRWAHTLRGSAATFGCTGIEATAGAIELVALHAQRDELPALIGPLREQYLAETDALRRLYPEAAGNGAA
jgi:CheY-like chemotaxis protein/HPt (histidine-containing phosphotransfer) domain-containing protein/anti-sigma regulatory factor (Ser/Thr protein kinase)